MVKGADVGALLARESFPITGLYRSGYTWAKVSWSGVPWHRPSWLPRSSATDAACLRRPSVVVVEPAQHREGHDAPAGLYAARPLPLVRDPLPDPLVRSPPVEVSHPFGEHAA